MSGAFTAALSPMIGGIDSGNKGINAYRTAAAALVGGTAAELGGGKFANGAITGAFVQMFNDEIYNKVIRRAGELIRGKSVLEDIVLVHVDEIRSTATAFNVDPKVIAAIIFEEQTHLTPLEGYLESFGVGATVGLGQITEGYYGYSRHALLNPKTNIFVIGLHLGALQVQHNSGNQMSPAQLGTLYNCGTCTSSITSYGTRIENYVNKLR